MKRPYKKFKQAAEKAAEKHIGKCKIAFCGQGSFGCVFKAKGNDSVIAVKVTDAGNCKREFEELTVLKKACSVYVPKSLFCEEEDGLGCLGMEFVDGKSAYGNFSLYLHGKKKCRQFAEDVADGVFSLRQTTNGKFGELQNPLFDSWTEYYRPVADRIIDGARRCEDRRIKRILPIMEKLYWLFDFILAEKPAQASLIHGDLCPMNMLVNPKTLELKAFIDPLNMLWADGEYELFQLFSQSGSYFRLYEVYKEKYPVSRHVDIKCALYAMFAEVELFLDTGIFLSREVKRIAKRAETEIQKFRAAYIER